MAFHVYIIENPAGRLYVGHTDDLPRRLLEHNAPEHNQRKYTTKHAGPWRLVWSKEHASRAEAMRREREIKSMRSSRWIREKLLQQVERVPARRD